MATSRSRDSLTGIVRRGVCAAGCLTFMWMVGCGAPSSDKVPGQESRAAIAGSNQSAPAQSINQEINKPGPLSDVSQAANTGNSNQRNRLIGKDEESSQPQPQKLPESITKDLASPDARERFRALSHWEENGEVKAPLDAVFEAMEDEDEAVRAKATAIVEQRWAAEH
ncbi:MAG: hypothetical protein HP477_11715, partial [Nitrospira sp.]|nr:hypothetical protein [Nitrospira sp.]